MTRRLRIELDVPDELIEYTEQIWKHPVVRPVELALWLLDTECDYWHWDGTTAADVFNPTAEWVSEVEGST